MIAQRRIFVHCATDHIRICILLFLEQSSLLICKLVGLCQTGARVSKLYFYRNIAKVSTEEATYNSASKMKLMFTITNEIDHREILKHFFITSRTKEY